MNRLLTVQLDVEEAAWALGGFAQQGIPLFLVHLLQQPMPFGKLTVRYGKWPIYR